MPWLAAQTRPTPIGSSAAVRISRSLAAVGSAAKRRAASLSMIGYPVNGSAEFPEQVAEIVGHGFAQRIVIDRAQRTADIAGPLLAALLFVGRLLGAAFFSAPPNEPPLSLTLNLLVPPCAGTSALRLAFNSCGATGLRKVHRQDDESDAAGWLRHKPAATLPREAETKCFVLCSSDQHIFTGDAYRHD